MLAREFIFQKLERLSVDFPTVEIKYFYSEAAQTHIVELTPLQSYYGDIALENSWIAIVKEFILAYPAEDLSFVSTDSLLHTDYAEFTFNKPVMRHADITASTSFLTGFWADAVEQFASKVDFQHIVIPARLSLSLDWQELTYWHKFTNFDFKYDSFIRFNERMDLLTHWDFPAPPVRPDADTTVSTESTLQMAA